MFALARKALLLRGTISRSYRDPSEGPKALLIGILGKGILRYFHDNV